MIRARLSIGSFNLILCYYLTHIKFAIQHRCYQLNDQDIVCGMRILVVTKERKNVLELGNGTTDLPFSKQRLQCTTSFIILPKGGSI